MDSPLIGSPNMSIELLRIETNLFNLYIYGKPFHPTVDSLQLHRTNDHQFLPANLQISIPSSVLDIERILTFNPETRVLTEWQQGDTSYPLFFETQPYELVIEKKEDNLLSFFHENIHIRQAVKQLGKGRILSGVLNFQNEVGLTDLEFHQHGQTILGVQLEMFPVKMDYKRDYQICE